MTLTEARQAVADALSAVAGYDVRARPFTGTPKPGDGWVTIGRIEPAGYTRTAVTLTAVIVFGADQGKAEQRLEEAGPALVAAVADADPNDDLPTSDVVLEPVDLVVGTTGALYGATITLTTEVD